MIYENKTAAWALDSRTEGQVHTTKQYVMDITLNASNKFVLCLFSTDIHKWCLLMNVGL